MSKYKFILTLEDEIEVDSAEEIEGHIAWPNWSQADPVHYKGIFDSYEEAKDYASDFELYKYIIDCEEFGYYDSFYDEEWPRYFISIFDAEDAACRDLDVEPGCGIIVHPEYTIEKVTENDILDGVYKYCLYYNDTCILDSLEEYDEYFDIYENAEEAAKEAAANFEIDSDVYAYKLEKIEILNIKIVEIDE